MYPHLAGACGVPSHGQFVEIQCEIPVIHWDMICTPVVEMTESLPSSGSRCSSSKVAKKLHKKASAGLVTCQRSYFDCRNSNISASTCITIKRDATRSETAHDLNAFEVRDLMRSVFSDDTPLSKLFDIRNKGYIRHCFVFNVVGARGSESPPGFSQAIRVRASRKASNVGTGNPASLLARLLTFPAPSLAATDAPSGASNKRPRDEWGPAGLSQYVLSAQMRHSWGYPVVKDVSSEMDSSHSTKRARLDGEAAPAVLPIEVGAHHEIPIKEVALQFLNGMNAYSASEMLNTRPVEDAGDVKYYEAPSSWKGAFDIVALDCEMCDTSVGLELTRCSLVDGVSGVVLLDVLVKPDLPIIDYRSAYSGITKAMLDPISTQLEQVQAYFLSCVGPNTVLVGHSLESDLHALRVLHYNCVDTAHLYPHVRGFPYRNKLKYLAREYLHKIIQHSSAHGHDSIEDAQAALELVKLKVKHGSGFGIGKSGGFSTRLSLLNVIHEDRQKNISSGSGSSLSTVKSSFSWVHGEGSCANVCRVAGEASGVVSDLVACDNIDEALKKSFDFLKRAIRHKSSADSSELYQYLHVTDLSAGTVYSSFPQIMQLINNGVAKCLASDSKAETLSEPPKYAGNLSGHLSIESEDSSFEHILMIVAQQNPLGPLEEMLKLRRTCSGPKATMRWTSEQEEELRQLNIQTNCGALYFKVI